MTHGAVRGYVPYGPQAFTQSVLVAAKQAKACSVSFLARPFREGEAQAFRAVADKLRSLLSQVEPDGEQ